MIWIVKRIVRALVAIFLVLTLTFLLLRLMPGNPIDMLLYQLMFTRGMDPLQATEFVRVYYGILPSGPIYLQYLDYLRNLLSGNLGLSITVSPRTPVNSLIVSMLPWTLLVLSIGITISFSIGILLGMFLAYRRGGKLDSTLSTTFSVLSGIPSYVGALAMLLIFAMTLRIFPPGGTYSSNVTPGWNIYFIGDVLYHAALPILTYVILSFGGWAITMKNVTISVLGEDYVLAAEARGLKKRRITISYVGRNAILPMFTSLAISLGNAFGGSLFIEQIFTYTGIGYLTYLGLANYDYPILQGCFLLTTISVIVANFIADIGYSFLDPRIKLGEK